MGGGSSDPNNEGVIHWDLKRGTPFRDKELMPSVGGELQETDLGG